MKLIRFAQQTEIIAERQEEYQDLPAHRHENDPNGSLTCCWKLTLRERIGLLFRGKLWHTILTFNQSLQPQMLSTKQPDFAQRANTEKSPELLKALEYEKAALREQVEWLPDGSGVVPVFPNTHACATGDCPHERQADCEAAQLKEVRITPRQRELARDSGSPKAFAMACISNLEVTGAQAVQDNIDSYLRLWERLGETQVINSELGCPDCDANMKGAEAGRLAKKIEGFTHDCHCPECGKTVYVCFSK